MYNLIQSPSSSSNADLDLVVMKNLTELNISAVDELSGRLDELPTSEEIEELIFALHVPTLRKFYLSDTDGQHSLCRGQVR